MTEYLLLLDQPAKKMPSTPIEDMAVIINTPTLKSRMPAPLFQGRKEKVPTEAMITKNGAMQ